MNEQKFEKIEDLITANGLLVNGIGTMLTKLDKIIELLDKNIGFKLHFLEKKMDTLIEEVKKAKN